MVVLYSILCFGIGYVTRAYRRERMGSTTLHQRTKPPTEFVAAFNRQYDDGAIYATIRSLGKLKI